MNNYNHTSLPEQLGAVQDWWRCAGVDYEFVDEPQSWLKAPEDQPAKEARTAPDKHVASPVAEEQAAPPPAPAISVADLPATLADFQSWWTDPAKQIPGVIPGAGQKRIAPRGVAGARIMLVVPAPEAGDEEKLLDGIQGRLLANILRALGIGEEGAYFASALPAPMIEPDWTGLAQQGLGTVLAHHIALVGPDRVLLLGSGLPLLLGHGGDAAPETLSAFASPAGKLPMLATFAPDRLLGHARQRERLWHRLLEWMK